MLQLPAEPSSYQQSSPSWLKWARATLVAVALTVLVGVTGAAFAQPSSPSGPLGPDQLRRWAIPERIDPRDFELDSAMVRVFDAAYPESSPPIRITWLEDIPVVDTEDLDRSQRAWFDPAGVEFSEPAYLSATAYRAVPAGANAVRVGEGSGGDSGADSGAGNAPSFTFAAGGYYTIVLAPAREDDAGDGGGRPSIHLIEDRPGAPSAGRAGVRVVQVANTVEGVELWTWRSDVPRALTPPGGPRGMFERIPEPLDVDPAHLPALSIDFDPSDAFVVLEGPNGFRTQFFGHATLAMLPEGPYTATVTRDGFERQTREFVLQSSERVAITILLEEDPSEEEARLAGPPPPDRVPPVWTMPMSDVALLRDVAHNDPSDYVFVRAPGYALEVRPAGTLDVLGQLGGASLAPGGMYTLFVVDGLEGAPVEIVLVRDGFWGPEPVPGQP